MEGNCFRNLNQKHCRGQELAKVCFVKLNIDFVRLAQTHGVVQFVELCVASEDEPFLPSDADDHFVNLEKQRNQSTN